MKINELIEMPKERKYPSFCGKDSDNIYARQVQGYNQAIDEISQIEIPPEKLLGMVSIDEEELAIIMYCLDYEQPIETWELCTGDLREEYRDYVKAIAANKSSILKLKPTLD